MKISDLRTKSKADLIKENTKLRAKLADLRKDLFIKDMKNVREIRAVRKDIARTATLVREKELEEQEKES